jgi:hypothetical protein
MSARAATLGAPVGSPMMLCNDTGVEWLQGCEEQAAHLKRGDEVESVATSANPGVQ